MPTLSEQIFLPKPMRLCSMLGAVTLLAAAVWLWMPWETFTGTSPLYAFMEKVPGGENTWGFMLVPFALPRFYVEWKKVYHARFWTTILSLIGLFFLVGIVIAAAPKTLILALLLKDVLVTMWAAKEI